MKRILIAADDSACSLQAVRESAVLLGPDACAVRVLSVIPPAGRDDSRAVQASHRAAEDAQEALDLALGDLAAAGHRADGTIRVGDPATTILMAAREFDADLIVVGTHGRTGEERARAGSVAEDVLKRSACGVLVYPLREHAPACQNGDKVTP